MIITRRSFGSFGLDCCCCSFTVSSFSERGSIEDVDVAALPVNPADADLIAGGCFLLTEGRNVREEHTFLVDLLFELMVGENTNDGFAHEAKAHDVTTSFENRPRLPHTPEMHPSLLAAWE